VAESDRPLPAYCRSAASSTAATSTHGLDRYFANPSVQGGFFFAVGVVE
jgi:hypothetical protein